MADFGPHTLVHFDTETASTADLRKCGAYAYAENPETRCIVLCYAIGDGPVRTWLEGQPFPAELIAAAKAGARFAAWNVAFDFQIWNQVLARVVPGLPLLRLEQTECVMARALYWGLPGMLDAAGPALGLGTVKDKAGHALMLRMCRPRAFDERGRPRWWHLEDAAKLAALARYCGTDVAVERLAAKNLPPLPDRERRIWLADQRANARGVALDMALIREMKEVATLARGALDAEMERATGGLVRKTSEAGKLLAHVQAHGYRGADLKRNTILAERASCNAYVRKLLDLRLDAARTSTAKLDAMLACVCADGRVRGVVQHYGAGRTGRWAGRLIQPQNFPRPTVKQVREAIKLLLNPALLPAEKLAALDLFFGDSPMGVLASCLRGCIVPAAGKRFVVVDFAQIEARVNPWLAGQEDVLDVFRAGQDVYTHTARKIGSDSRQLGKVLVLACGFGMGWSKFQATAAAPPYKLAMSDAEAANNVRAWREANAEIVAFWYEAEAAAKAIARGNPGDEVAIRGGITLRRRGGSMFIILPSGRHLVYRRVRLETDADGREALTYDGVDQRTRRWGPIRTYGGKLVENIVQAVARDVMADALLELEARGLGHLLTVHDEDIIEADADVADATLAEVMAVMTTPPAWAAGLPVGADGHVMDRYGK